MRKLEIITFLIMIMCISGCQKKTEEATVVENEVISTEITSEITTEEPDTTPPEIIVSDKIAYSEISKKLDYNDLFEVRDDKDSKEELKIDIDDSNVDYEKPGKYSVRISATDLSNNKATESKDIYLYKDYTYEEMVEICNKLVDEKYFDFQLTDYYVEKHDDYNYGFQFIDGTAATDNPTGETEIYGYIDWLLCCSGLNISISENESHKNKNVSWNSEISLSVLEYTNYGELEDIKEVDVVSKTGKLTLSIPEDVLGKWLNIYDEPDYKVWNAGLCFRTEDDVDKFIDIINGANAMIIYKKDNGDEITRIKLNDEDKINYNSAIALYKDINEYICNIPNDPVATSTDASASDADN